MVNECHLELNLITDSSQYSNQVLTFQLTKFPS